jgi:pimeloyl-ACP methyl ester carboxylesterase
LQTRISAFDVLTPPNPEYHQLVSAICFPILFVIGDVGAVVSPETASELQSLNSLVRIEQIQDAGHGLPYDQPARLAVVVKAFLKSIVAR